jgi:hypothetical protein
MGLTALYAAGIPCWQRARMLALHYSHSWPWPPDLCNRMGDCLTFSQLESTVASAITFTGAPQISAAKIRKNIAPTDHPMVTLVRNTVDIMKHATSNWVWILYLSATAVAPMLIGAESHGRKADRSPSCDELMPA